MKLEKSGACFRVRKNLIAAAITPGKNVSVLTHNRSSNAPIYAKILKTKCMNVSNWSLKD